MSFHKERPDPTLAAVPCPAEAAHPLGQALVKKQVLMQAVISTMHSLHSRPPSGHELRLECISVQAVVQSVMSNFCKRTQHVAGLQMSCSILADILMHVLHGWDLASDHVLLTPPPALTSASTDALHQGHIAQDATCRPRQL